MRTSSRKLNPSLKRQIQSTFSQIIADIDSLEDASIFLQDFFTDAELEVFAKRISVAYWLKKERSYTNIKNNLKVSSATIADVSSQMEKKGFIMALKKIEVEEWANKWMEKIKKFIK